MKKPIYDFTAASTKGTQGVYYFFTICPAHIIHRSLIGKGTILPMSLLDFYGIEVSDRLRGTTRIYIPEILVGAYKRDHNEDS
jgi:hypothetical protein